MAKNNKDFLGLARKLFIFFVFLGNQKVDQEAIRAGKLKFYLRSI